MPLLLSLPNEILLTILHYLTTGYDQFNLSQSCRRLYLVSKIRTARDAYAIDIEILAQRERAHAKSNRTKYMFSCSFCMQLRPMHHFTRNHALKKGPMTRVCLFCIAEGTKKIRNKTSPYRIRQCLMIRPMQYWFGLSVCVCLLCKRLSLCPSVGSFGHRRYCYRCGVQGRHVGVEDIIEWLRCCDGERRTSLENVIAAIDYFAMISEQGVINHYAWLREMMLMRQYRMIDMIITQEIHDLGNSVAVGMGRPAEYWKDVLLNTLSAFFGGTITSLRNNLPPKWWDDV